MSLPAELRRDLLRWSAEALPAEACGVLVGERQGARLRTRRVMLGRNIAEADQASAFELHPEDIVAASVAAERAGLEVVGIWHSHPAGPAEPSRADLRGVWEGWVSMIVGLDAARGTELRAWRTADAGAEELELEP